MSSGKDVPAEETEERPPPDEGCETDGRDSNLATRQEEHPKNVVMVMARYLEMRANTMRFQMLQE